MREAARALGAPAHLVTEHGKQFTAHAFRQTIRSLGIRPRYGAAHRHGSIAVIERWWTSMKVEYVSALHLFRPLRAIEAKLRAYVRWFHEERPHPGLEQRAPDEVHLARTTAERAVPRRAELVAVLMDGDRDLPVLRLRRVAWTNHGWKAPCSQGTCRTGVASMGSETSEVRDGRIARLRRPSGP